MIANISEYPLETDAILKTKPRVDETKEKNKKPKLKQQRGKSVSSTFWSWLNYSVVAVRQKCRDSTVTQDVIMSFSQKSQP